MNAEATDRWLVASCVSSATHRFDPHVWNVDRLRWQKCEEFPSVYRLLKFSLAYLVEFHTTDLHGWDYSPSTVTMALSCINSELKRDIS